MPPKRPPQTETPLSPEELGYLQMVAEVVAEGTEDTEQVAIEAVASPVSEQISAGTVALRGTTGTELELRRELARSAVGMVTEVLDERVSVALLLRQAEGARDEATRMTAVRALRFVHQVAQPGSELTKRVGEVDLYHVAEAVVKYGASRKLYLELLDRDLSPEQVTGLYALRDLVDQYSDGRNIGMPTIFNALNTVGVTLQEAADDPDGVLELFAAAGMFVTHFGRSVPDQTAFYPSKIVPIIDEAGLDGAMVNGILKGGRQEMGAPTEEQETEKYYDSPDSLARALKDLDL